MDKLKLHTGGSKTHLQSLKKELNIELEAVRVDSNLNSDEKARMIKKLKLEFEKKRRSLLFNLY